MEENCGNGGTLMNADPKREMLRHAVATLAYRGGKALRGMPAECAGFCPSEGCRTPLDLLAHIGDLLDWALSIAQGRGEWKPSKPSSWDVEGKRFFAGLKALDDYLASEQSLQAPVEKLFQGPVADALTHVGQLAIVRRMAGSPIRGESYFAADIKAGTVGRDQPAPKYEF
jgi:hypothetical protein